jgi:hypothetical protein
VTITIVITTTTIIILATLTAAGQPRLTLFRSCLSQSSFSDLRRPHEWYPIARLMRRKLVFHGGPTNSGKTYHALERLKRADPDKGGGVYLGPLRLLALEVGRMTTGRPLYTGGGTNRDDRWASEVMSSTLARPRLILSGGRTGLTGLLTGRLASV